MSDLHDDLTALAGEWGTIGCSYGHAAQLSALLAAHTPPSEPATAEASHQQRADHFQHLYEQASEGRCGHSGLTIGACKASICDCFEFPWVKPAPDEHPDPAPPSSSDADRDTALGDLADAISQHFPEACWCGYDPEDLPGSNVSEHLRHVLAARSAQPVGVERVEWGVRTITEKDAWDNHEGTRVIAERRRDELIGWLTVEDGPNGFANGKRFVSAHLIRRTVTEFASVVGEWELVEEDDCG